MSERRRSSVVKARKTSTSEDAAALAQLGIKQELKRNFSTISMLGLAFAILNTWTALSASISLALPSGGPTAIIWGLILSGFCNFCAAASLAEFLSAYPTAGGQYHWAAIVSWRSVAPALSWITGWINTSGWVALSCAGGLLVSQFILGAVSLTHAEYELKAWHQFLIYVVVTVGGTIINVFSGRLLPLLNKVAFTWSMLGFAIITITVLACATPEFQSGSFVYGDFINLTGWPDGVAWLLGNLQACFSLTAFDAVVHMIEEMHSPQIEGPRLMLATIGIGVFTGFVFLSALLFSIRDLDTVISSTAGPLLQILYDVTQSRAGAICLLVFPLGCLVFAAIAIFTTTSRMIYAFARDGGLPFSKFFAQVHPTFDVPVNALGVTAVLNILFGCILLGSSSAFNAIISSSVVLLGVSYAIPPAINCMRGRRMLPANRAFVLRGPLGWICNLIAIAWTMLTTVLFTFPPALPVTGSSMNYCVVAFAIVMIISMIQWIVDGRKNYHGPRIDGAVLQGELEGLQVTTNPELPETGYNKKSDPDNDS